MSSEEDDGESTKDDVKLACVMEKGVRLSQRYFSYSVTFFFFLCKSGQIQEQIAKKGYGLSILVGVQHST